MTELLLLLGRWGVPEPLRKLILFLVLVLLLGLILGVGKCTYDRTVIEKHDAQVEASQAKADRKADNRAAEQRRVDDARLVQERRELEEVMNVPLSNPAVPDVVERRLAFHRCLRLQQAARENRQQPPSCV